MEPAAIRYKNPGAMWNNKRATKWGSTGYVVLNDGQKNHIAIFPTFVQGAAAQFDLWASNYTGLTLKAAIDKWSGHNSPASYVAYLTMHTGISADTVVTKTILASPSGWKLLKWQSHWEAGKAMPMTDEEWQQAQQMFFNGAPAPESDDLPYLKVGDKGEYVKKMQTLLNNKGASIKVDGIFGRKETLKALMLFQEQNGLRDDGVCGDLTWAALKK